jgi:hypothetical protein
MKEISGIGAALDLGQSSAVHRNGAVESWDLPFNEMLVTLKV